MVNFIIKYFTLHSEVLVTRLLDLNLEMTDVDLFSFEYSGLCGFTLIPLALVIVSITSIS